MRGFEVIQMDSIIIRGSGRLILRSRNNWLLASVFALFFALFSATSLLFADSLAASVDSLKISCVKKNLV